MKKAEGSYRQLLHSGELQRRVQAARKCLADCRLCPHECGVDRTAGETGRCRCGRHAVVHGYHPHFGEEAPLVGTHGSGTIFFSWCNLSCIYCQNRELSHDGEGREVGAGDLAAMMLDLQEQRCHNINLVSPSHVVPQILEALLIAAQRGLTLPLVYNTGGYDSVDTLELLDGIVDIYLPDVKYADSAIAKHYSGVEDYVPANRAALREMHRQVGSLICDENGVARRGLLIRHLILPDGLAGTAKSFAWIARELASGTWVNIMEQYRPCGDALSTPPLDRRITSREFSQAIRIAHDLGLHRLTDVPKSDSFFWGRTAFGRERLDRRDTLVMLNGLTLSQLCGDPDHDRT